MSIYSIVIVILYYGVGTKSLQQSNIKHLPKSLILTVGVIILVNIVDFSRNTVLAQSRSECEEYARNYAKRNKRDHTLRGAAGGAATGALFGAIFDDAGTGAGVGAIVGGLEGSSRESSDYQRLYNLAYDDCIRGRTDQRDYRR